MQKTWIKIILAIEFILIMIFLDLVLMNSGFAYPIDGYIATGIRRLERLRLISEGKLKGNKPISGACKLISQIKLNLLGKKGEMFDRLPAIDQRLQKSIDAIFPDKHESYSLAVLDITQGKTIRFAARQIDRQFSPGSVGKLAIAAGLFTELKRLYPESIDKRIKILRDRIVIAGSWIHDDHHEVPVFNPEDSSFTSRPIRDGDKFSLYEWIDHMLSASANAAASTLWKELILMRYFGKAYPPSITDEVEFFKTTSPKILTELAMSTINDPLREIGIKVHDWQLGSFFTREGKKKIPGGGKSQATPLGLIQFLIAIERGKLVDEWSSLEIKKIMYMSARRIRYAASPVLNKAAVYFKSGSIYRCKPEPDFTCRKYRGNVENIMNSVAIIEHDDGRIYMVVLMSNILRKNSAEEHLNIATRIDKILKE
ncbi:MAG: hypothetical protein V1872_02345 [bacterium]